MRDLAFPRHTAPEFCKILTPKRKRAQGRPGARCTRGLMCKGSKKNAHEHTGSAEAVRPSLRNGFTAYLRALPGETRACLSPSSPRSVSSFKNLTPAIGASGPHDFAVRVTRRSSKAHPRPSLPAPTSVTMANAPSLGTGCANKQLICLRGQGSHFRTHFMTGKSAKMLSTFILLECRRPHQIVGWATPSSSAEAQRRRRKRAHQSSDDARWHVGHER